VALGHTVARLGASCLVLARQRLELASLDFEEELLRTCALLVAALATVLMGMLALAAAASAVVICFWDSYRLASVVGVMVFFGLVAGLMAWRLSIALRDKPRFLAGTLAELDKDRELGRDKP
jgi:uncharacterized membrane protein YqjE